MDMYGQDFSGVDDLLDFSNDDVLCSSTTTDINTLHPHYHNITSSNTTTTTTSYHFLYPGNNYTNNNNNNINIPTNDSTDFTDGLSVPSNDVAELEWLSNFVHDSFSNFPANNIIGTINYRPHPDINNNNNNNSSNNNNNNNNNTSFQSRSRTKRSARSVPTTNTSWTTSLPTSSPTSSSSDTKQESEVVRRCTHCASEKTPQWRTGPLGPKTLCNACGVRYKSGRLVPEYRPAASPTFVLTQHSNSHRKVMELRRQKEVMVGVGQQQQSPTSYHHRNRNNYDYEVC